MPFNSSANSYGSVENKSESFDVLRNSYNIAKEGFNHIPDQRMIFRPTSTVQQYILPANNHSSISYHNIDELKYINHEQQRSSSYNDEEMVGEGIGRVIKKSAKKTGKALKKSTTKEDGLIHMGISKGLDYAIPAAGTAIGTAIGTSTGNPALGAALGAAAGDIGRKALKKKTGYGDKEGVGKYEKSVKLDKIIDKYVYNKGGVKKGGSKPKEDQVYVSLPQKNT